LNHFHQARFFRSHLPTIHFSPLSFYRIITLSNSFSYAYILLFLFFLTYNLIKHRKIINYVKSQRLSWFGHINRMPETSVVRKIHKWKPFTSRPVGRLKFRWEDFVRNDMIRVKLTKWTEKFQDRLKWKPRLYRGCSAEEEESNCTINLHLFCSISLTIPAYSREL
jgi:ABC-type multidrug transport system fused ATPase/permease subunit